MTSAVCCSHLHIPEYVGSMTSTSKEGKNAVGPVANSLQNRVEKQILSALSARTVYKLVQ